MGKCLGVVKYFYFEWLLDFLGGFIVGWFFCEGFGEVLVIGLGWD